MLDAYVNNIAIGLLITVGLIVLVLVLLAFANPVLAKLGVRNIPRRPAQSVLIVVGLTLSTIIFITSLALGDTLNYSIQRHAVDAFGAIDQVVAPPLLALLTNLDNGQTANTSDASTQNSGSAQQQQQPDLLANSNLDTLLSLIDEGLPGIPIERYNQFKADLANEPLVDGAAPSILFPTIIRDVSSGQGEPLGFIVAIDDSYSSEFGLHNQDGEPVKISSLRPGVGNIFELTSDLFGLVGQQTERLGFGELKVSDVLRAALGVGALASTPLTDTTAFASIADQLGVGRFLSTTLGISNTGILSLTQQFGITDTSLSALAQRFGISDTTVAGIAQQLGLDPAQLSNLTPSTNLTTTTALAGLLGALTAGANLAANDSVTTSTPITANNTVSGNTPTNASTNASTNISGTLGSLLGLPGNIGSLTGASLLEALNLNTVGQQLDQFLGQYGLQLRQGEVYLNRLGADQLNARVGDSLEIYIGPIPLPYRVKGIVNEAGPAGALTPVVLMRLDEAQRLLFMEGKVNNILISHKGDNLEGMQYTSQVAERMRVLSINEQVLGETVTLLRTPEVQRAIDSEIERMKSEGIVEQDAEIPEFLRGFINSMVGSAGILENLEIIKAELTAPEISTKLREAMSKDNTRASLADLDVSSTTRQQLNNALSKMSDMMVIEQLSKQTVVTAADVTGRVFSTIFSLFGIFSILAGILLIFLIYVMMAAERRSEMGMARAIGVQRSSLVRMFVTEGMIYDLVAAALGVLLGIGIAYLMIGWVGGLFNSVSQQFGTGTNLFQFRFRVVPASMVIAYSLGVLLTFVIVWFASWRVSRLNIVTAIRNLPDESSAKPRSRINQVWRWVSGPLLIAVGGWLAWRGFDGAQTYFQMGGSLILWGLSLLLARLLERTSLQVGTVQRIVYSLLGVGLLVVWGVPWNRLQGRSTFDVLTEEQGWLLAGFALQAPMLILGAIITVMFNADTLLAGLNRLVGGIGAITPALKMAIAYPLSSRFRTAMAMVMFSMIVATVVIMAVVIQATQTIVVQDEKDTGGFEIYTSSGLLSFFDPISDLQSEIERQNKDDYPQLEQIALVGGVAQRQVEAQQTEGSSSWHELDITGVTNGYLAQAATIYPLKSRAAGFADDAAIWKALQERDDVAIISPGLLQTQPGSSGSQNDIVIGDGSPNEFNGRRFSELRLTGIDLAASELPTIFIDLRPSGSETTPHRLQVIGLLEDENTRADGDLQVNLKTLERVIGEPTNPSTYYIKIKEGANVRAVANEVERVFLSSSLNATVAAEAFAQGQAITRGILRLFQGFMALGLLVGIAALGVISSRSVVERRQQVGMLRAVGFQSRTVALTFLIESSFIALTGIIIGALTGLLLGENMVRTLFTDLTPQTNFATPWGQILIILLIAYGFSLLTTILPALQAARIYPAEALRYE